ncbi:cell wall protein [Streptomyces sp. NPDC056987]|uniref:cell wall protein n=1 Tax=Streptomyces sp. NPDC056987 TaxID=3345988 RepID=UPI0036336DE9
MFALVRGREQDVVRTESRRTEPRAWLRSVVWLVGAGLHPRSGASTVVVARDLAGRMDYRRGTVLYDLDGTVRRTGLSRATVKRHVRVLRELGALVWLVHGSKRNLVLPGEDGYVATATVYGAVIPRAFDAALGHRLSGSGYEARVCGVTEAGRERAVAQAVKAAKGAAGPVDNRPVDQRSSQVREPHSLGRSTHSEKVDVDGGSNYTSRKRASRSTPSRSITRSSRSGSPRRPIRQVARDIVIAREVRPLVPWVQGEQLRRLAFALRPLIDEGLDVHDITAELHAWHLVWRPANPAGFITAELAGRAKREAAYAEAVAPQDNAAWSAYCEDRRQAAAFMERTEVPSVRTDEDRLQARYAGIYDPQLVLDACEEDFDDALDLYGVGLVSKFWGVAGNRNIALRVS